METLAGSQEDYDMADIPTVEGTHGDAVNYAAVEFVMDVGSFSRAPSIITSTLGEILLGGWRDPAERMMKRRATNEKTEQRWEHSKEGKVRPVVEITTTKKVAKWDQACCNVPIT